MNIAEAWTIEQLVLDACYSARPNSLDSSYAEWGGVSELRDPTFVSLAQLKTYTKTATDKVISIGWRQIWYSKYKLKTIH